MGILSIRLNDDLQKRLDQETQRTGLRRSDVVRRALEQVLPADVDQLSARERYERVKHLIGSVSIDIPDLGRNHEEHLRRIFDAKRDDIMGRRAADRAD
jgi:predicted DNA-binding protein